MPRAKNGSSTKIGVVWQKSDFLAKNWNFGPKKKGKILVYAQCPSCPLPFRPSEMPFPQNDLPFNALHQNALLETPFQICPSSKCPLGNANSNMPSQKCPFKNALSKKSCLNLPFIKLLFITNAIFSFISNCEISNSEIMKRLQLSGKLSQFSHYLTPW